ncbi:MAG: Fe-S cluster assembly protein SufD [Longimicrobiales bacterium]
MAETLSTAVRLGGPLEGDAALALTNGQPTWFAERRRHAARVYDGTPMPTTRLEEWRYTEIARLQLGELVVAEPRAAGAAVDVPAAARALLDGRDTAGTVLQVDAGIAEIALDETLSARGVVLADLASAAADYPDLVEPYLATKAVPPEFGKFAALNGALWTAGVFLYVPDDVALDRPIRIARWLSEAGTAVFPRTLVVAGRRAKLALVEAFGSPDFDKPALSCGAVEIYANESAEVQHVVVQDFGRGVRYLSAQRTIAGRDADLDTLVVNLGASVARVDLAASLEGPGARSDMLGLYFGREDQHFDHNTRQDHIAPHAASDLLYKGALYDRSRAVFRGIIRVHEGAQRTDAYQTNRNLLLSEDARADSLPNLEIEADDVRCSHGATVGQLDEEEIFYLMTRGLTRQAAERLVIFGFMGEVLGRLPLPGVVAELKESIERRIA